METGSGKSTQKGADTDFLLHFAEKIRNCAVRQIIIVSLSWYVFLQNHLTAFMNTLPIHKRTLQRLCRFVSTILVVVFVGWATVHAQESLPVKDYSVGNQFVYSVGTGIAIENIIADTLINGNRYGIAESNYGGNIQRYYMRSTDAATFQYDTTSKRESMVYSFGEWCVSSLGMSWMSDGLVSVCGYNSSISNPMMLLYGNPNYNSSNASGGYARYIKPYGITEFGTQYCHLVYSQGYGASRPAEYRGAGWYTVCSPRYSARLISGVIRGKVIDANGETSAFFLRWSAANSLVTYGQTQRITLQLTNALYGVPANRFGITSARCKLTLDTALVDIVSMKTAKGNRPDSVTYKDGKALLYCSFSVTPEVIDIGYIDVKSKSPIDTTLALSVENYAIVPAPIYAMTSTLNLSLKKPDAAHLRWVSSNPVLNFNQTQRVFFKCSGVSSGRSIFSYDIPAVYCKLSLDTSFVRVVNMQTAKGNRFDSVSYSGRNMVMYCTFATDSIKTEIGFIDILSRSPIDTVISLVVENPDIRSTLVSVTTSVFSLSLQKLTLNFNITSASSASYGEQRTIPFGMQSAFTSSILTPPSYTISLDTLGLDSIEILAANSNTRIVPNKVTAMQGKVEYVFSPPVVPSYPFVLGRLRFRSKSLKERENLISVFSSDRTLGIDYIPASIALKQTGLATLNLKPDFVTQLEQGQNFVKHLAPNPAVDVLTVRYAMGASAENVQLELVNMLGIIMKSVNLADYAYGIHDIAVNVADIEPGIYFLRVRSNSNVEAQKVLIAR